MNQVRPILTSRIGRAFRGGDVFMTAPPCRRRERRGTPPPHRPPTVAVTAACHKTSRRGCLAATRKGSAQGATHFAICFSNAMCSSAGRRRGAAASRSAGLPPAFWRMARARASGSGGVAAASAALRRFRS